MLPPASPFLVEEFERLKRKIWESLIEADVQARYFARSGAPAIRATLTVRESALNPAVPRPESYKNKTPPNPRQT